MRLPRAATAAALALLVAAPAAADAAPTGQIAGRDNGKGSWEFVATVNWDQCPELCDWRIVADMETTPDRCLQSTAPTDTSQFNPKFFTLGAFSDRDPYTANGIQTDGVHGINSLLPEAKDRDYVLCLGAVGTTRGPEKPGDPVPTPPVNCFPADAEQCSVLFPLGYTVVHVAGYTPPRQLFSGEIALLKLKALQSLPAPKPQPMPAPTPKLTRAETLKALRAKKIKGRISCKKVTATKQTCTATNKKRKRRYVVTETTTGVVVRTRR